MHIRENEVDITRRLRQTRADMLGTDDEDHYWDCHEAAAEIERLRWWARLTDAEREAVRFCVTASLPETEKLGGVAGGLCRMHAATLRGLLERMGGDE